MIRYFLATLIAFAALCGVAHAQGCGQNNPNCIVPTASCGTSDNRAASTAFVNNCGGGGGGANTVPNGKTGQTSFTANLPILGNGTSALTQGTLSGNTTELGTVNGSLTSGDCVSIDANGNLVDAGTACSAGGANTVPNGKTGQTSFTANLPILGNGTSALTQGTLSGNTTKLATASGAFTNGDCLEADSHGNVIDAGATCGSGIAATPNYQIFSSPGSVTTLTVTATPLPTASNQITAVAFDGIVQARNTWSYNAVTDVMTFTAAIPSGVQTVEIDWFSPSVFAGVGSLSVGASTLSGAIALAAGNGISLGVTGQTITTSAAIGASLAFSGGNIGINGANTNNWTATQSHTIDGSAFLFNTPGAGDTNYQEFEQNGTQEWEFGLYTDNSLFAFDQIAGRFAIQAESNGPLRLMPTTGCVAINGTTCTEPLEVHGVILADGAVESSGAASGFVAFDRSNNGNSSQLYRSGNSTFLYDNSYGNVLSYTSTGALSALGPVTFTQAALFSGEPFADVKSGTNGCGAAVGDDAHTADYAAIRCQITYVNGHGGGIVFIPCGGYLHDGTPISVLQSVRLVFANRGCAYLDGRAQNVTTIQWVVPGSGNTRGAGVEHCSIYGYNSASATSNAVVLPLGLVGGYMDDCTVYFGSSAMFTAAIDFHTSHSFLSGYTAAVTSTGANWYDNDAFDTPGGYTSSYAFFHASPSGGCSGGVCENQFINCDFSGSYTYSLYINDTTTASLFKNFGGIFSSPGLINSAQWTMLNGVELGSTNWALNASIGGLLTLSNSYAFSATGISGGGASTKFECGLNFNISCP